MVKVGGMCLYQKWGRNTPTILFTPDQLIFSSPCKERFRGIPEIPTCNLSLENVLVMYPHVLFMRPSGQCLVAFWVGAVFCCWVNRGVREAHAVRFGRRTNPCEEVIIAFTGQHLNSVKDFKNILMLLCCVQVLLELGSMKCLLLPNTESTTWNPWRHSLYSRRSEWLWAAVTQELKGPGGQYSIQRGVSGTLHLYSPVAQCVGERCSLRDNRFFSSLS